MYYVEYEGGVKKFIDLVQISTKAKLTRAVRLMIEYGPDLGMPLSRKIDSQLYELRIRGTQEVRIFYTCFKKTIVMLHGFVKKTQKIPRRELEKAHKHLVEYK